MPRTDNFLGQLTDEIQEYGLGSYISEFVSDGPKNYSFNVFILNRERKNVTVCKVKGITLNYKNSKIVNFESMRDMVCNPCAEMTLSVHNDRKIVRTSTYEVISKPENKIRRVNYIR
ncbi:hypothetical protein BDFB_013942 [Asbolus verrucosus]|uniref:Uncharacterized protein n=1 Tax=Asbolus verrucosus TaxID=1661398 RepID=A0A482VYA5_ASBVE|nr:hypothetical protein BDFB_013942 [Asbolus verrucosus]